MHDYPELEKVNIALKEHSNATKRLGEYNIDVILN